MSQQPQTSAAEKPAEPKPATQSTQPKPDTSVKIEPSTTQETSPMDLDFGNLDPSILESIVTNLPNVDKDDPTIKQFLQNYKDDKDNKDKK